MEQILKDEAHSFFQSYSNDRTAGLRINPLKMTNEEWNIISPFSLQKIPFTEYGYYYDFKNEEPGKHPYHLAGLYYIQEPSAMFIAQLLDVKPGDKVLDLCAAPGGKSTQIGAYLQHKGLLVSNEIHPKRAKALSENIERMGVTNAIVTNETPSHLSKHFPQYFDKILVDAPCSGEGMFRKDPEAIQYWSQEHVLECQKLQRDILEHAYRMLKEDGILVYSTCTFSPEENEENVEWFLSEYPDMELVEINKSHGIEDARPKWTKHKEQKIRHAARLWPHKLKGEGHFVAKFKKTSSTPLPKTPFFKIKTKKQDVLEYLKFTDQFLNTEPFDNLALFGSILHALPNDCPDLTGLKVLRAGLHLGEIKKNRFEPDHALALALSLNAAKNPFVLHSTEMDWLRYLKGETLKGEGNRSWILITIDQFPLGWGKEVSGMIKNHYPKGLRIKG